VSPLALALCLLCLPFGAGAAAVAQEGKPFTLDQAGIVKYGKGAKWVAKVLPAGAYRCNNGTFGDPYYGTVKECVAYSINAASCSFGDGINVSTGYSITSGAWLSQWCPMPDKTYALQIVAGSVLDAVKGTRCYVESTGLSKERLAKCAPGDVMSLALRSVWEGDAMRIALTAP
jgi:hypothetical protein